MSLQCKSLRRLVISLRIKRRLLLLLIGSVGLIALLLLVHRQQSQLELRSGSQTPRLHIRLPEASLSHQHPGAYLCTAVSLRGSNSSASSIVNGPIYALEFEPKCTNSSRLGQHSAEVHHMLLAECDKLPNGATASLDGWWNCGLGRHRLAPGTSGDGGNSQEMCSSGLRYLYAYTNRSPVFRLPAGVAMPIGDRGFYGGAYLVLQVHYWRSTFTTSEVGAPKQRPSRTPSEPPGLSIAYLPASPWARSHRPAACYLSAIVSSASTSLRRLTTGCEFTGSLPMRPFALRVHTHSMGRLVSVYRVRRPHLPQNPLSWSLIAQADPRLPQAYHPVNSTLAIRPGDLVAAVCSMDVAAAADTAAKPPEGEEMCNAWLMYWLDEDYRSVSGRVDLPHGCFGSGNSGSSIWSEAPAWVLTQAGVSSG